MEKTITTTPGYLATGGIRVLQRDGNRTWQRGGHISVARVRLNPMATKPDFPCGRPVSFLERSP